MKSLASLLVVAMVVVFSMSTASAAGRPDPTGQGRYQQFGPVMSYPGARVVRQLPVGAGCAPAGELVGVRVWNSTRYGFAVISELSDRAMVAVSPNGETFLCGCAGGYNQIFLERTPTTPAAVAPPAPMVAPVQAAAQPVAYYDDQPLPSRPCGLIGAVTWLLFGTCEGPTVAVGYQSDNYGSSGYYPAAQVVGVVAIGGGDSYRDGHRDYHRRSHHIGGNRRRPHSGGNTTVINNTNTVVVGRPQPRPQPRPRPFRGVPPGGHTGPAINIGGSGGGHTPGGSSGGHGSGGNTGNAF